MYCVFRWVRNVFPPAKAISRGVLFVKNACHCQLWRFLASSCFCWRLDHRFSFSRFLLINSKTEYRLQSPLEVRYWRCSEVCRHRCIAGGFEVGLTAPSHLRTVNRRGECRSFAWCRLADDNFRRVTFYTGVISPLTGFKFPFDVDLRTFS